MIIKAAVEALGDDANNEDFFIAFAKFEERQKVNLAKITKKKKKKKAAIKI